MDKHRAEWRSTSVQGLTDPSRDGMVCAGAPLARYMFRLISRTAQCDALFGLPLKADSGNI